MSYRIPNSSTNLSSATGWDTVTNVPTLHASTNITLTGSIYSLAYTAPNTTNYATGAAIMITSTGYYTTGGLTLTATLQEYNGSTWNDTAANGTMTIIPTASGTYALNSWVYFRYGTPYKFTTTTAGYYRVKLTRGSASQNSTARADTGGSNPAFMATDDRTGAVGSTDDLLVLGHNFSTTPITVTWDGTASIGSGQAALTDLTTSVTLQTALYIGSYGTVTADTVADVTTTCTGHVMMALGSTWNIGSVGTAYPSARTFTWLFNPTTTCDFSFRMYNGTINFYGQPKSSTTLWKTTYSSGSGTAADPLILADAVDWSVGDEICLLASSNTATNYNEMEYRFIITKNSATSYVVSSTKGGGETALSYTHTNAYVINLARNIIFTTTNSAKGWFTGWTNSAVTNNVLSNGYPTVSWVRFEYLGRTSGGSPYYGGLFTNNTLASCSLDYSVFYGTLYYGWYMSGSVIEQTYTGLIFVRHNASANFMLYCQNSAQKTFADCFFVDNSSGSGIFTYSSSNKFLRCIFNCVRRTGYGGAAAYLTISTYMTFTDCEFNCCAAAVGFFSTTDSTQFITCQFGTKGYNGQVAAVTGDFYVNTSPAYMNVQFIDCTFGSPTLWPSSTATNYRNLIKGSEVKIHRKNATDNVHYWWTPYGSAQATGSGLSDTLVRTPGSLNVRISPEDLTNGFTWSFLIPATKNTTVSFSGYFLKNIAMGTSVCTVSLYLPGNQVDNGSPDATATLNNNTSATWTGSAVQPVSISAYYTGTVDGFATVAINAKSVTAGAYLYCADFFNSGDTTTLYDKLAGLSIWYNGKPAPILTALNLGGIAPAVWSVATSGLTAPGTTGKKLGSALTTPTFIALK